MSVDYIYKAKHLSPIAEALAAEWYSLLISEELQCNLQDQTLSLIRRTVAWLASLEPRPDALNAAWQTFVRACDLGETPEEVAKMSVPTEPQDIRNGLHAETWLLPLVKLADVITSFKWISIPKPNEMLKVWWDSNRVIYAVLRADQRRMCGEVATKEDWMGEHFEVYKELLRTHVSNMLDTEIIGILKNHVRRDSEGVRTIAVLESLRGRPLEESMRKIRWRWPKENEPEEEEQKDVK